MKVFYSPAYNGMREKYERVSRWIRIRYNAKGDPYFIHCGRRRYFEEFVRALQTRDTLTADDGEEVYMSGYDTCFYSPLFVELDEGGEGVRVYQYKGTI